MDKKKSFVMYDEWQEIFEMLPPEEAVTLLSMIFEYSKNGNLNNIEKPKITDRLNLVWIGIRNTLERDKISYDKRCETSKENGKKGGRPKNQKNLNKPKKADNDNVNDNVNDNDNDNVNDNEKNSSSNSMHSRKETLCEFVEKVFNRTISSFEYERINTWEDNDLTRHAIEQTMLQGKTNLSFVEGILRNYKESNLTTLEQVKKQEEEFKNKRTGFKKDSIPHVIREYTDELGYKWRETSDGKRNFIGTENE